MTRHTQTLAAHHGRFPCLQLHLLTILSLI